MEERRWKKIVRELIEFYTKESKQTNKFKLYAFLFLASFIIEKELEEEGINIEEFRKEMIRKMEESLRS